MIWHWWGRLPDKNTALQLELLSLVQKENNDSHGHHLIEQNRVVIPLCLTRDRLRHSCLGLMDPISKELGSSSGYRNTNVCYTFICILSSHIFPLGSQFMTIQGMWQSGMHDWTRLDSKTVLFYNTAWMPLLHPAGPNQRGDIVQLTLGSRWISTHINTTNIRV